VETRDISALGEDANGLDAGEIQYLVLAHAGEPFLLARVRWPDVAQAVTPGCLEWQEDVGLFDLPGDPGSAPVTLDQAVDIAVGWGAQLPSEPTVGSGPLLIRRMPANWSDMPPAERRAWSLDLAPSKSRRRRPRVTAEATPSTPPRPARRLALRADRRPSTGLTGASPRKERGVALGALAYEDTWDRVFAAVPALAIEASPDEVPEDEVRLPSVFAKMKNGPSSQARSMFTRPADLGLRTPRDRFTPPDVVDKEASESSVLS
jgi:hypothetical protein